MAPYALSLRGKGEAHVFGWSHKHKIVLYPCKNNEQNKLPQWTDEKWYSPVSTRQAWDLKNEVASHKKYGSENFCSLSWLAPMAHLAHPAWPLRKTISDRQCRMNQMIRVTFATSPYFLSFLLNQVHVGKLSDSAYCWITLHCAGWPICLRTRLCCHQFRLRKTSV